MDILVIDDNTLIQQVMERYLGDLGYRIAVAGTAAEAIAFARQDAPTLAIVDMHLPDSDGPAALRELRRLPGCASLTAIGVSGLDEAELQSQYGREFREFLSKPVDLEVLEATVRKYVSPGRSRGA